MLKVLIKKQLLEIFQNYFVNKKTGKARDKKGILSFILLFVLVFGGCGISFYSMAEGLAVTLLNHGYNWLYFAITGLISIALGVFGSVFNTYAALYLPKDNELLLSLPIKPATLLTARLFGVYVMSLLYSSWIWIPITICYWAHVPMNLCNVLFPILLIFVISLFVSVLSCILGYVVALVSAKAKGKSFLTLFLSLAVMVAYYFVYFKAIDYLGELTTHIDSVSNTMKTWLLYIYGIGMAADGNILSMLSVSAVSVILAAICILVLSKSFLKLAAVGDNSAKKVKVKTSYSEKGQNKAILLREYKHFTSVPTWMLNGGFGLLILPIGAIGAFIKQDIIRETILTLSSRLPMYINMIPVILLAGVCLIISTSGILPVSISIEGKNLWILQSLPIDPWKILRAKEDMYIQMAVIPSFFFVIVSGFVLGMNITEIILVCLATFSFIWLNADFGLFLNLKNPNLEWTNAAYLTKQSLPVIISMFGGWAFCAAFGFGAFFLGEFLATPIVLIILAAFFAVIWYTLHSWIKNKGTKIFMSL